MGTRAPSSGSVAKREIALTVQTQDKDIYWLNIGLHIGAVAIHIILLVLWALKIEQNVKVPLGSKSNTLSQAITISSQVIGVGYTAIMLTLTQQLTVKRYLHVKQPLTAIHDKIGAWSGIGQAGTTVIRQFSLSTGVAGILAVFLYLGGVSILHITTPALFTMSNTNITQVAGLFLLGDLGGNLNLLDIEPELSIPILSSLSILSNTKLPGLEENTIFGSLNNTIPPFELLGLSPSDNVVLGSIPMQSATFQVSCGLLPGSSQTGSNVTDSTNQTWDITTPMQNMTLSSLFPYVIRVAPQPFSTENIYPQQVLMYGNLNVTDANGVIGTTVNINPEQDFSTAGVFTPGTWTQLQLIGCNLNVSYQTILVDGQTGTMISSSPSEQMANQTTTWQNWAPHTTDLNISDSWALMLQTPILSSSTANGCGVVGLEDPTNNNVVDNPCGLGDFLTLIELYINSQLGVLTAGQNVPTSAVVTLEQLERLVERMTAAVYWAGLQLDPVATFREAPAFVTQSQLTLNIAPLAGGLATSLALLALLLFLIRSPLSYGSSQQETNDSDIAMESIGLLQMLWLFRAQDKVAEVEVPTMDNLRQAGMVDVRLDGLRCRKLGTGGETDGLL